MPAWTNSGERLVGCKLVSVFPDNRQDRTRPSVYGSYVLMSGDTGEPLAVMDGTACSPPGARRARPRSRRRYLAREDAAHLVMIGAGALAPHLVARALRACGRSRA